MAPSHAYVARQPCTAPPPVAFLCPAGHMLECTVPLSSQGSTFTRGFAAAEQAPVYPPADASRLGTADLTDVHMPEWVPCLPLHARAYMHTHTCTRAHPWLESTQNTRYTLHDQGKMHAPCGRGPVSSPAFNAKVEGRAPQACAVNYCTMVTASDSQ